jgi:hypothetical protein
LVEAVVVFPLRGRWSGLSPVFRSGDMARSIKRPNSPSGVGLPEGSLRGVASGLLVETGAGGSRSRGCIG